MKSLDKAIHFVDSEEEDIKQMGKIYDEAEYMKVAYQKLQDAIEDVFDALYRGRLKYEF